MADVNPGQAGTAPHGPNLLFLEPYLNLSHRALADGLADFVPAEWTLLSLPGRFFRWRMRGAASYFAATHGDELTRPRDGLVCSSMLNLAELKGLAPKLGRLPALVYFHENQLAYPAPGRADDRQQKRDLFLAFSNLTTLQAAKLALFNSRFQMDAFFQAADELLDRLPDAKPDGLSAALRPKCRVLPVPLDVRPAAGLRREPRSGPLRIVWNHRWEHDKGPQAFFQALFRLAREGARFQVAVLGPRPARWPRCFDQAPEILGERLVHLGMLENRRSYWERLFWADLAVSAARQENQGLAVAEAVWAGCRPLLPNRLVYPELYPGRYLYPPGELYTALRALLEDPARARAGDMRPLAAGMAWEALADDWRDVIRELTEP